MNWLKINLTLPILVLSASAMGTTAGWHETQHLHFSIEPCASTSTQEAAEDGCGHSVNDHLDYVINQKMHMEIEANIEAALEESLSAFQQRALKTRAYKYLLRDHRDALEAACILDGSERTTHLNNLADEIGVTGSTRTSFIAKINKKVERGTLC